MYGYVKLQSFDKFDDLISEDTKVLIRKIANRYNDICYNWNTSELII